MKIVVIFGSHRKTGQTMKVCQLFESEVKKLSDADFEYIILKEADLKMCVGCVQCLPKGEEFCPHSQDDRDKILAKMDNADGIVFACSNYALNVPNIMKNFFDRTAFVFHRPRFFHKVFTGIVTQGIYGGGSILKYFKQIGNFWGGITVPGITLTLQSGAAYDLSIPWNEKEKANVDKATKKLAQNFVKALQGNRSPQPKWFNLLVFRGARTFHKYAGDDNKDFKYYNGKGWLESDYYYPIKLGIFKKLIGKSLDSFNKKMTLNNKKK